MLAFDWLEWTDKILSAIFSLQEWLVQSYAARLFGNTFLNFVSNFSLEGGNWVICLWQHHISKMGILNVPFCSIFVPFHFYLVMTLVVPCLETYLWFCWSLNLQKNGRTALKPVFWILVPLRGGGFMCACVSLVCSHCTVHILISSKKLYFLCL